MATPRPPAAPDDHARDPAAASEPGPPDAAQLHDALHQGQLRLFYQSIVDADCRLVAREVLLRWQHPQHGLLTPEQFLPLAEAAGLLAPIGDWVLDNACHTLAQWQRQQPATDWLVGVNISAAQLTAPGFCDSLLGCLQRSGADPTGLCLELIESSPLEQPDNNLLQQLNQLRALGLSLALDDFGTGYSALSHLQWLPVDYIKIDSSFVRNLPYTHRDRAIVEGLLELARRLEIQVVAEGVETLEQFDYLCSIGCFAFQGYLFDRPAEASPQMYSQAQLTAAPCRPN